MKNNFFLLFFLSFYFFIFNFEIFSQENNTLIKAGNEVVQIEISTNNVDVYISSHDKNFIAYEVKEKGDKRISAFENKKKLQFYTTAVTEGEIFIYLPKNFLLESCRIQSTNSKIEIQNIKSIYFVLSVISSDINVLTSKFKNVLLAINHSKINFSSGIVAVADFCMNTAQGTIEIAEKMQNCNLFMTQIKNKNLVFNGEVYKNSSLSYAPKKPKKYISISASFSELDIKFIPPLDTPSVSVNKYGISEFGPVPPPKIVDPVSNFLPGRNK